MLESIMEYDTSIKYLLMPLQEKMYLKNGLWNGEETIEFDYLNECISSKQLLLPKDLDKKILERGADSDKSYMHDYLDKVGFGVMRDDGSHFYTAWLFKQTNQLLELSNQDLGWNVYMGNIGLTHFFVDVDTSIHQLEQEIDQSFEQVGTRDYSLLCSQESVVADYFINRYFFSSLNKGLTEIAGIQIPYNHEMREFDVRE